MKNHDRRITACAAAMLLCLLAAGWSLLLMAGEPTFRRDMEWYCGLDAQTTALEHQAAELDALAAPFAARTGTADSNRDITSLFGSAQIQTETGESASYRLTTFTVTYPLVSFNNLVDPLNATESMRPPFKLISCHLEATPGKTGEGRARLVFEHVTWR